MKSILSIFLKNYKAGNSRQVYKRNISQFSDYFNVENIDGFKKITKDDVIYWIHKTIKKRYSRSTCYIRVSVLSMFYRFLKDKSYIKRNIMNSTVEELKAMIKKPRYF